MYWLANRIKDLLFPKFCAGCEEEGSWLCATCFQKITIPDLTLPSPQRRGFCGPFSFEEKVGMRSGEDKVEAVSNLDGVTALFNYGENTVSKLIKMFKYNYLMEITDIFKKIIDNIVLDNIVIPNPLRGEESLSSLSAGERVGRVGADTSATPSSLPLGKRENIGQRSLAEFTPSNDGARDDNWQGFTIIPVPLHPRRERERGFNQAEIIANLFAEKFGLEMSKNLRRIIYTTQQVKLSGEERRTNLKNAFDFNKSGGAVPEKVLLVDDVFTTGTTMQECAKVLKNNGVKVVWGLALARG